jgi:hypothetical protein
MSKTLKTTEEAASALPWETGLYVDVIDEML